MILNSYYGNGATAYTTAGELPSGSLTAALSPASGYMYMAANSGGTTPSIVLLGNDGTAAGVSIFNAANSILRLTGTHCRYPELPTLLSITRHKQSIPWGWMPP